MIFTSIWPLPRYDMTFTSIWDDLYINVTWSVYGSVPFYSQSFYWYWRLVTVPSYSQCYTLTYYDYYISWIWLYHYVWQVSLVRQRTLTRPEHLVLPFLHGVLMFERSTCYANISRLWLVYRLFYWTTDRDLFVLIYINVSWPLPLSVLSPQPQIAAPHLRFPRKLPLLHSFPHPTD